MKVLISFLFLAVSTGKADTIRIALSTKKINLDPTQIQDVNSLWVSRQISCQMVKQNGQSFSEDLAKRIFFKKNHLLRIELKDRKFADGSPVLAQDVVASLRHLNERRTVYRNIFDWISNIAVVDSKTIEISLAGDVPNIVHIFSLPNYAIFPATFLKKAKVNTREWNSPIGCGNFKVQKFGIDSIVLKNLHFERTIIFDLGVSPEAIKSKKYDLLDPVLSEGLNDFSGFETVSVFDPKQILFGINSQLPRWQNKKERCELLEKIKQIDFLKTYRDNAERADQLFPRGVIGYVPGAVKSFDGNPGKINELSIAFLQVSFDSSQQTLLSKEFGKTIEALSTTVIQSTATFANEFKKSRADAMMLGLKSNYLDGYEFLLIFSSPAADFTGSSDKKLAESIRKTQIIADPVQRGLAYQAIWQRIKESCLVLPLVTLPYRKILVSTNIQPIGIGEGNLHSYDLERISVKK